MLAESLPIRGVFPVRGAGLAPLIVLLSEVRIVLCQLVERRPGAVASSRDARFSLAGPVPITMPTPSIQTDTRALVGERGLYQKRSSLLKKSSAPDFEPFSTPRRAFAKATLAWPVGR